MQRIKNVFSQPVLMNDDWQAKLEDPNHQKQLKPAR